jgi:hypothetical protein
MLFCNIIHVDQIDDLGINDGPINRTERVLVLCKTLIRDNHFLATIGLVVGSKKKISGLWTAICHKFKMYSGG